jgi:hypothetical protein
VAGFETALVLNGTSSVQLFFSSLNGTTAGALIIGSSLTSFKE